MEADALFALRQLLNTNIVTAVLCVAGAAEHKCDHCAVPDRLHCAAFHALHTLLHLHQGSQYCGRGRHPHITISHKESRLIVLLAVVSSSQMLLPAEDDA
jgi:hypothetical protein